MTHRPVGAGASFAFTAGTATTSTAFSVQSDTLRVVAVGAAAHVAIAASPATSVTDYYIPSGTAVTLAMTKASNRVVGVTTGATTILTFAEGTQAPFGVGDYISLTASGQSYYDFSHQRVASVDTSSGVNGYFQSRITVSYNSTGIVTAFAPTDATAVISQKIAAYGAGGGGALYYQQVQITNQA
jgi:hypothetical protein